MTRDKWNVLMDDAHFVEKPFLYLYRLYIVHPWWVFGFFTVYCIAAFVSMRGGSDSSGENIAAAVFIVGIGPLFFFFGIKTALWVLLRVCGFQLENLKIE